MTGGFFAGYDETFKENFFNLLEEAGFTDKWKAERKELASVIADKDAKLADKDAKLADKDAEIARLHAELEKKSNNK